MYPEGPRYFQECRSLQKDSKIFFLSPPDEFMKMNNSSIKNILLYWRDVDSIMNRKRLEMEVEVEVEVEVLICIIIIVAKMRWFTVVDVE